MSEGAASRRPRWAPYAVAVASGAALAAVFVASDAGVARIGFLLWFRHEGRGAGAEGLAVLALFAAATALTAGALTGGGREGALTAAANVALKLALLAAVAFMLAHPHLPQLADKSLTSRAVAYPLLAFAMPVLYLARRMRGPYPTLLDACWTFTFTVDIVGNDLHWYGNWRHWDDAVHFVNAVPFMAVLVAAVLAFERDGATRPGFWEAAVFALAVFTALHSLWETGEHLMDRIFGTVLQPGGMREATRNQLSSIGGSLCGVGLLWWWRRSGALDEGLVGPAASYVAQARAGGGRPPEPSG